MYINIIMTILTNRQKINIYLHPTDMLYKSSHRYIFIYILSPHRIWTLNHMYGFFITNYFQVIYMVIIKIFPSNFRCLFLYIFIKTGRQTYIVHQTSTSARYFCILKSYTIIQQTRWICYAMQKFFSPKQKLVSLVSIYKDI